MSEPFKTSFLNFQKLSHGRLLHRSQWHQLHPRERLLFSVQDFWSGKTHIDQWNEKQLQPGRGRSAFPSWNPDYTQHLSSNSRPTGAGVDQPDLWLLNQELVETILYSMDRQKDGYIRLDDLVAGLRSSTSFSLSMYREEFILVGLMVAGFLLYQVQVFASEFLLNAWPSRWQSSTVLCRSSESTTALSEHDPSIHPSSQRCTQ